jgi:hypothetical protein
LSGLTKQQKEIVKLVGEDKHEKTICCIQRLKLFNRIFLVQCLSVVEFFLPLQPFKTKKSYGTTGRYIQKIDFPL